MDLPVCSEVNTPIGFYLNWSAMRSTVDKDELKSRWKGGGMAYNIALIPGDGIGREVVPEAVRVMDVLAGQHGFELAYTEFPYSCEHYLKTGVMLPPDGIEKLSHFDAILLGAVGDLRVADHVSLWGLLLPIRRQMQQYVNVRPVRLLPGIASPLADRTAEDIDFIVVRENNEGEYSEIGGRLYRGTDAEMVVQ